MIGPDSCGLRLGFFGVVFRQRLFGNREGYISSWYRTVDGCLEQDFFDLVDAESVATCCLDVHSEILPILSSHHRGQCDGRTHATVEAWAGPNGAPRAAGAHLMEVPGEIVNIGAGARDNAKGKHTATTGH